MRLKVHAPVPNKVRSREDRIGDMVSIAEDLLNVVRDRTDRYKFGVSDADINMHYRFSDYQNAHSYFSQKFKQFGKNYIDELDVRLDIVNSVNALKKGTEEQSPSDRFKGIADQIGSELLRARELKAPYVSILTGPTGSGKTAFSKCLFTSGAQNFWRSGIIPTRVEFTRFFEAGQELTSGDILSAIHQCQVRDLLIFLCFSKTDVPDNDEISALLLPEGDDREFNMKIRAMADQARGKFVDGHSFTLREAHSVWKEQVGFMPPSVCADVLNKIRAPKRTSQFLVSLDGFDALKAKDFLVSDRYHGPISAVADLLGDALNQVARYGGTASSHNTNLMVFMRDTTYARMRLELHLTPNGERSIPVRSIIPPPYSMLAETIALAINRDVLSETQLRQLTDFVGNIRESLISVLKGTSVGLSVDQPISSAFSWNARHMKRHIRRICLWSLENYVTSNLENIERRQQRAGLSIAWLWEKLIANRALRGMAAYSALETFYLDDTKCLQSKFRLNSRDVSDRLEGDELLFALSSIKERPELEGLFDSIFNYLTKGSDQFEGQCHPHTLVLVRILQILKFNSGLTIEDIYETVSRFYESISLNEVRFYVICLCENEYIVFEGVENSSSLDECRFFVSNFGLILIGKVIFSVSYASQSMMIAELIRSGFGIWFRERNFRTNEDWIASCAFNAILALNIISDAELAERRAAIKSGLDFEKFSLTQRLRESLSWEIRRIFGARRYSNTGTLDWHFNNIPESFKDVQREYPDFDTLPEIWK